MYSHSFSVHEYILIKLLLINNVIYEENKIMHNILYTRKIIYQYSIFLAGWERIFSLAQSAYIALCFSDRFHSFSKGNL